MTKRKTKREATIHEKAIRLVEGGYVNIDGLWVRAVSVVEGVDECNLCDLDCICRGQFVDICIECNSYGRGKYLLKLIR